MIQIATVPYTKTYKFHYLSDTFLLKLILYTIALIIPFFLVYSVNNFYLSFTDTVTTNPTISYNYNYHLIIQTSSTVYTYSTLYQLQTGRALSFGYQYEDSLLLHSFNFRWSKPVSEKVKKVSLIVFMKYSTNSVSNAIGMCLGQGYGYNIGDLSVVGTMKIQNGLNKLENPPTSHTQILSTYNYDFPLTMINLQKNYKLYLRSSTNFLANNMPTNVLNFDFKLKAPQFVFQQESSSILGQLVWSFMQYFPIACVFWFVSKYLLRFLLRENVVQRILIHDKI